LAGRVIPVERCTRLFIGDTKLRVNQRLLSKREDYTVAALSSFIPTTSVPLGYKPKAGEKNESGKDETEGSLAVRDF
jgi:hypothetical protein